MFPPDVCVAAGLTEPGTQSRDGIADIEGDGFALSVNLGVLIKPRDGTKLGVAFRSGLEHELDGTADFTNNAVLEGILAQAGVPLFVDGGVTADASLPPTLMFSAAHKVHERVELLADATWTGWSSFDELRVEFDNPIQPDTFNTLAYDCLLYTSPSPRD